MENNQSVQQESSEVKESAPIADSSEPKSKKYSFKNVVIYLFMHYPWLFLAGLLLMFLGGGALSIYSLSYVDDKIKSKDLDLPQPEAVPKAPVESADAKSNPIPLWMVATIALSCASGCIVILKVLNRPKQKKKVKRQVVNRDEIRLAQRRYQAMEARLPKRKPVRTSQSRRTPIMAMPPQKARPKPAVTVLPPVVTVLPPEHNSKPNQKNKDSLADIMDIRKQTSLSSMLRK